jgi:hypothetical protein
MKDPRLAFDRSVRYMDPEGRLHVETANISKANVCPYYGQEIPGWEELGLNPQQIYQMLRDPAELEAAASRFNRIQVLNEHIPVDSHDHQPMSVVGATGSDARYEHPYLKCSLVVWEVKAIAGIMSKRQRELSSAYSYDPDMTPGVYEGIKYDGVMRNISGNHVCLVPEGRAGSDVVVGDRKMEPEMPKKKVVLSRKAALVKGAVYAFAKPLLAKDAKLDITPLVANITAKNYLTEKPKLLIALDAAIKPLLAQDASAAGFAVLLDALDPGADMDPDMSDDDMVPDAEPPPGGPDQPATKDPKAADPVAPPAADPMDAVMEFLGTKLNPEDLAQVSQMMKPKAAPAMDDDMDMGMDNGTDGKLYKEKVTMPGPKNVAMDTAIKEAVNKAVAAAISENTSKVTNDVRSQMREIAEAREAAIPHIGKVNIAMDSAAEIYGAVLKHYDIDPTDLPVAAMKRMVAIQKIPVTRLGDPAPRMALDAAASKSLSERFPDFNRLRNAV